MNDSTQVFYKKQKKFYKYLVTKEMYKMTCVPTKNGRNFDSQYFSISSIGDLTLKKGYRWDGASGPTKDDGFNQRGSAVHDCLYQCIRLGIIDIKYRAKIDRLFYSMLLEDGKIVSKRKGFFYKRTYRARAWYYYRGVRFAGKKHCRPVKKSLVFSAP